MASEPLIGGGTDGPRDKHRWAESKVVYTRKSNKGPRPTTQRYQPPSPQTLTPTEDANSSHHQILRSAASDDSSSRHVTRDPPLTAHHNGFDSARRVTISLSSRSRQDLRDLRRRLARELDQVRSLVRKLEAREAHLTGYTHSQLSANNNNNHNVNAVNQVHSEVASGGPRPPHQLSVSVFSNSQCGATSDIVVDKEKRTPKANQHYRNSDFLLGKDRFPPPDKRPKSNGGKKHGGDNYRAAATDRVFKDCSALLSKLMKHKHGWVFNSPVDVKGLGLHDYYSIIKRPMDLGTVNARLSKNWYKSPREFAEDVRLTFQNAMMYNPKNQDVHIMAEQLLKMFEDRWAVIESEHNLHPRRFDVEDAGCSVARRFDAEDMDQSAAHKMRKSPPPELKRTLDRSESTTLPVDSKPVVSVSYTPTGRVAVPKKPKAKDPNKRDMTYEEKQKLSTNLVNLPPEKLDNIVQIIKKRNSDLSQHDDEIEVDIDSFDAETLWELDRFVTNYKKSLSKNKKKNEIVVLAREETAPNNVGEVDPVPEAVEAPKESRTVDEKNVLSSSPVQGEKKGDNANRSSSSSSSSSESGSSSDSDSGSSSASGSDAAHSPRT
ncbi:transcription factor GTE4-like [Magnolia sinica]|uniref:transcription factor GTE4-like n=1 Tax=Magnolia sinica TaxID=86752 RepID=UPI002659D6B1|nr:transcription factor GTE4-like [Magnolia sinica]XP_058095688.1 transcription factor GTE4-like [Magnolia sinica]